MKFEKRQGPQNLERWVYEEKGEMDKVYVAVTIYWKSGKILALEFYSSLYGIAKWEEETKKLSVKSWEEEEEAQKVSHLNYHYTGKMLSGRDLEVVNSPVLEDCLQKIKDKAIVEYIKGIMG